MSSLKGLGSKSPKKYIETGGHSVYNAMPAPLYADLNHVERFNIPSINFHRAWHGLPLIEVPISNTRYHNIFLTNPGWPYSAIPHSKPQIQIMATPKEKTKETAPLTLYSIEAEYLHLRDELEALEGELTPEIAEKLAINETTLRKKIGAYLYFIDSIESEEAMIAAIAKKAKIMAERKAKKAEQLKAMVLQALLLYGTKETSKDGKSEIWRLELPEFARKISTRRSESLEIIDEDKVPVAYWNTPKLPDPKPDKDAIKKDINMLTAAISIAKTSGFDCAAEEEELAKLLEAVKINTSYFLSIS